MTEKRFTIIDMEEPRKQSVAEKGIPCTARHCCTRLNRLTEENEQLKEDNMLLIDDSEHYRKLSIQFDNRNKELISENEQLKKELESFKPIIFESDGKPITLYEK